VTGALAWLLVVAAAAPASPLTEADAIALALRNSPRVKSHDHLVVEANAQTEAGLAWNNPQLRVSGLRYDQLLEPAIERASYGDHPLYHTTVTLRWAPPGLGERAARRADGQAKEAEASMELTLARRDTVALVRKLYAEVQSYDGQIVLVRDVAEQRERLCALVKNRLAQQVATALDQNLAEVEYLDARTELAKLEVSRRAAYDELLLQLGLPSGEAVQLAPVDQAMCSAPDAVSDLAARARAVNPRLRLIEAQDHAAEADRSRRGLSLIPWFDYFQVGYGMAGDNRPSYVSFQFQLTLPLFDWKGPHRRALAARHEALLEQKNAEDRRLSDTVLRLAGAQAAQAAVVARYGEATEVVEGGLARLRKAVEQGQLTNLVELVQLQTRLLAIKRSHLRALLDCQLQRIELDRISSDSTVN
jgi:outer membrane protein TolC